MKRLYAIIVVFVLCASCALLSGCGIDAPFVDKKTEPSGSQSSVIGAATSAAPTSSRPATAAPSSTAAPFSSAAPSSSLIPASTASAAAAPTSASPAPTASASAAPEPTQSSKPAPIQLRIACSGEPMGDDQFILVVDVVLDCYDISISSAKKGSVTFNGETRSFVTEGFSIETPGRNSLVLHSESFIVPLEADGPNEFPISAEWNFRGNYAGQAIDALTAETTVTITL